MASRSSQTATPSPAPRVIYKPKTKSQPAGRSSLTTKKVLWTGAILGLLVVLCAILDSIRERFYIFDVARLRQLQLESLEKHGNNTRAVIDEIVGTLRKEMPPWSISEKEEWFFNNAAGAMGGVYIIHASITEYLIIFGSPVGTEGHSGRHTADDYFHILHGEQTTYKLGSLTKEVYPVGSVNLMKRGEVRQYKFHDECWALEYARGWIPPMMPMGLADTFFSTVDFVTLYDTIRITAREMLRNLLHGKI